MDEATKENCVKLIETLGRQNLMYLMNSALWSTQMNDEQIHKATSLPSAMAEAAPHFAKAIREMK